MKKDNRLTADRPDRNRDKTGRKVFLLILFSLIMPTLAGVVIGVREITDQASVYFVQFSAIFAGCLISAGIVKKSSFSFREIGFRRGRGGSWVIGMVLVEAIAFTAGLNREMNLKTAAALILFMTAVGFFEEIIYRGFILQYLKKRNMETAVIVSSILFGMGHIVNLLGGAEVKSTIAQIIFAVLFGFVCAEIVFLTNSIVIGMIWHTVHNVIAEITAVPSAEAEFVLLISQCIILVVLGVILWRKLKR